MAELAGIIDLGFKRRRRRSGKASTSSYDADAQNYFNAVAVPLSTPLKDVTNTLVTSLKSSDLWGNIIAMGLGPMEDEQQCRVNLKTPAQVATITGSPTFTAKQGYAGDGTAAMLDLGILGSALTDTDNGMYVYVRTNGTVVKSVMGYRNGRHQLQQGGASKVNARLITNTITSTSTTNSGSNQFIGASRTGGTTTLQVGTAIEDTDVVTTDTLSNTNTVKVLGDGVSFSDAQLTAWVLVTALANTKATALGTHIATFKTAAEAL